MKNFLLALMAVLTTCTLAVAQTTVVRDSTGEVKVTVTKGNEANTNNTAITVIGVDAADADSADVNTNSSNVSTTHSRANFTFDSDDSDFPFRNVSAGGGILVTIIAIVAVFGFPVFILFIIFFPRHKNQKARYRLAEQAFAAGQPLPAEFTHENKIIDLRSQGIKNTLADIDLFIFLWIITGKFRIGATGLLVTFIGTGQWAIGSKRQIQDVNATRMYIGDEDEKKNPDGVRTDSFEITPSESEEEDKGVNGEKSDENR